ncbi:MAG: MATE family efflux transporter [Oscillospiraceae bacterium]|nr:MATE family efflux transporter [Oscillospiraceae bacterium]
MVKDMTKGGVAPILLRFSLPLLISVIFQQFYSIADSVIAGRFINKDALSAIGASYPITMIFLAVGTGMNVGCSVVISTLFGAKNIKQMKTAVYTSLISTGILAAVLTVAGYFTSGLFLRLLGTDESIFPDSQTYLNIYVFGLLFLFIYNICTGIFTALGDGNTPLYFLMGSSVGNVVLDLLFVAVFKMGVAGTAWATFICQGICSILAFVVLVRRITKMKCGKFRYFELKTLGKIATMSIPSILQQSFVSVGNLFIQRLVNDCGTDVVAGYTSAIKLNTFAITSFATVGNSVSSFTAQNIGAGEYKRVRKGFRVGALLCVGIAVMFTLIYVIFSNGLIYLFMDKTHGDTEAAAEAGRHFLTVVAPFYAAVALKITCDAILRGGRRAVAFMVTTFSDLILRVVFAFILCPSFGATGIWLSWPVGWVISGAISITLYIFYIRKLDRSEVKND